MAQKKFVVTGATGHTGSCTVERLPERGHAVRALAHREDNRSKRLEKMGAEAVIGDFLKFNDVRAAMRGVPGAHFCYPTGPASPSPTCVTSAKLWNRRRRSDGSVRRKISRRRRSSSLHPIRNGSPANHHSSREVFVRHLQKMTSTTRKEN